MKENNFPPVLADFMARVRKVKKTRWVRFLVVSAIFVGWVAWLGSWWVLIFLPPV